MSPSVANSSARERAVRESIKGNDPTSIKRRRHLIDQLGQKRPKADDPARPAYDAAFDELRSAIGGLDDLTVSQVGVYLNVSDSAWRHVAAKASAAQLGRRMVRHPKKTKGARAHFVYHRKAIEMFWRQRQGKARTALAPAPSAIATPPTFESTKQTVREPFYTIVDPTGAVVGHIVVNGLSREELHAVFAAGAQIVRQSLTQALQLPWINEGERRPWFSVWNQAVGRTRARIDEVALQTSVPKNLSERRSTFRRL
jgi:hypothetical protein